MRGVRYVVRVGVFAPAATPNEAVAKLNATIPKGLAAPAAQEKLRAADVVRRPSTLDALGEAVRRERGLIERPARPPGISSK